MAEFVFQETDTVVVRPKFYNYLHAKEKFPS